MEPWKNLKEEKSMAIAVFREIFRKLIVSRRLLLSLWQHMRVSVSGGSGGKHFRSRLCCPF